MKILRIIIACGFLFVVVPPISSEAATKTVTIPGRTFDPRRIVVRTGDTVRWVVDDNERHTVTASSDSRAQGEDFDSSPSCPGLVFNDCLRSGQTYPHTFTAPGTFTYFCKRHGTSGVYPDCGMCGQVVVRRKSASSPTTPGTIGPSSPGASGSGSPSATSPSPSATGTSSSTSPRASAASDEDGLTGLVLALVGVALLGGSGYLVYRNMIRR